MTGSLTMRFAVSLCICLVAASLAVAANAMQETELSGDDFRALEPQVNAFFKAYPAAKSEPVPFRPALLEDAFVDTDTARDLMEDGANFAGRYVLMVRGCGTECLQALLINPVQATQLPSVVARHGLDWRPESRALILNPPSELAYFDSDAVPTFLYPRCFLLVESEQFEERDCPFMGQNAQSVRPS